MGTVISGVYEGRPTFGLWTWSAYSFLLLPVWALQWTMKLPCGGDGVEGKDKKEWRDLFYLLVLLPFSYIVMYFQPMYSRLKHIYALCDISIYGHTNFLLSWLQLCPNEDLSTRSSKSQHQNRRWRFVWSRTFSTQTSVAWSATFITLLRTSINEDTK